MSGSKSTSSSKSVQFGFTELEELLQGINLDIVRQQFDSILKQVEFQSRAFDTADPAFDSELTNQRIQRDLFTPEEQRERLLKQFEQQDRISGTQDELLQRQLDLIRQGPGATDEQRELINQSTQASLARGESDILDFSRRAIEQVREELAPSRGLRPTDTPIQDRGFSVAEEATRQQGQLATALRGQQAEAELNFPLQANAQQAALAQFQQQLGTGADAFTQNLNQQAFQNRLALTGQTGQLGLGLTANAQPQAGLQETFRPQLNQTAKGQTKSGGVCSRVLKFDKAPLNYKGILEALLKVPVESWRYVAELGDHQRHVGPYAEDFKEAFNLGDGQSIEYMDAIGVLMASVHALADRVNQLEAEREDS